MAPNEFVLTGSKSSRVCLSACRPVRPADHLGSKPGDEEYGLSSFVAELTNENNENNLIYSYR